MKMTLYQAFKNKWAKGCGSELCPLATKRVFSRGFVPCQVLFVGEAPGISEDVCGFPFVGPAGHLLDHIVEESGAGKLRCGYTNLLCCIPKSRGGPDLPGSGKLEAPPPEAVEACAPRLQEFVRMCDLDGQKLEGGLRLVVAVGAEARDWLDTKYRYSIRFHRPIPIVDVVHPAAIMRSPAVFRGFAVRKAVVTLRTALRACGAV